MEEEEDGEADEEDGVWWTSSLRLTPPRTLRSILFMSMQSSHQSFSFVTSVSGFSCKD